MQTFNILFLLITIACSPAVKKEPANTHPQPCININRTENRTIATRFVPPEGYTRTIEDTLSFAHYLRSLKLKPDGTQVKYFNGNTKPNHNIYCAVVDLDIGQKDLHQCADAIIRLRAEYLWKHKKYEDIHFNLTNGHKIEYTKWRNGNRINIEGNRTWWSPKTTPSDSYQSFWDYLEQIFTYAGTASLEQELKPVDIDEAQIGDILIQGGHPGHAVIIVDKIINQKIELPLYMLAQSYMPAQELHVLINPNNPTLSPWYSLKNGRITTPEWQFQSDDLMSF